MESSLRWVRSWTESQYQRETWCCQPPVMFSTLYILVFCSQLLPFDRLLCRAVRPTTNFSELPNYEVFFHPTDFCFFVFCWRIKVVSLQSELLPNHTLTTNSQVLSQLANVILRDEPRHTYLNIVSASTSPNHTLRTTVKFSPISSSMATSPPPFSWNHIMEMP